MIAAEMVKFLETIVDGQNFNSIASDTILGPIIDAMEIEGYYGMKPPCYFKPLVNAEDVSCLHGSPWSATYSQKTMAGDFDANFNITIHTDDNFHLVADTDPIHLAQINNTCDATAPCTLETITVSENLYNNDTMDTGYYPLAATEMKVKMMSRQANWAAAGVEKPDFTALDEEGNRCADINDLAISWAEWKASKAALDNYNKNGIKYVTGDDNGPYNAGPLWIWTLMEYTIDTDARTNTVQSAMMRTPTSYFIKAAAGFHYCKVLSPFNVLEWIYVDSLHEFDGIWNDEDQPQEFLQ